MRAWEEKTPFLDLLKADPEVTGRLSAGEIEALRPAGPAAQHGRDLRPGGRPGVVVAAPSVREAMRGGRLGYPSIDELSNADRERPLMKSGPEPGEEEA